MMYFAAALSNALGRGGGPQAGEIEKWATKAFELCFRVIFGLCCLSFVSGVGWVLAVTAPYFEIFLIS